MRGQIKFISIEMEKVINSLITFILFHGQLLATVAQTKIWSAVLLLQNK